MLQGVDLTGKVAVVTGGNSGLGKETARCLAAAGADVTLTARSAQAGDDVAAELQATGVKGRISVQQLDLADLASVRAAAAALQRLPRIDYLILNAGVMACPLSYTKDGFEMQIGTNHFGHWVLTQGLLDKLKAQDFPSRVVALSSSGHALNRGPLQLDDLHFKRRSYGAWTAYGQSKAANILFAKELNRRLQGTQVEAFSAHPGVIQTNLGRHMNGPAHWGMKIFMAAARWVPAMRAKNIPQGVSTTLYAATAPQLKGLGGAYLVDCAVAQPSKTCQDVDTAAKLWEVTAEQVAAAESPAGFKG